MLGLLIASSVHAEVNHTPFGPIKIGERAKVESTLTDNEAIKDARLYFKSNVSKSFSYTDLNMSGANLFASLPAPGPSMQNIEYFIAVKYVNGELEQTPVYSLHISGDWDERAKQEHANAVLAYTELSKQEDDSLNGFVDNVRSTFQAVKLVNKLGSAVELSSFSNFSVVAGPTSSSAAGAAGAASSGSSGSFGNIGWIGAGAAATVAAAAAAGGSSAEEEENDDLVPSPIVPSPIVPAQQEQEPFDPEGSYEVTLSGPSVQDDFSNGQSLESDNSDQGDCAIGSVLRFSPVNLTISGNDNVNIDLGGGATMSGELDGSKVQIFPGSAPVSGLGHVIRSTEQIAWDNSLILDFNESNSHFTSSEFLLHTQESIPGTSTLVTECTYRVVMTGHLVL